MTREEIRPASDARKYKTVASPVREEGRTPTPEISTGPNDSLDRPVRRSSMQNEHRAGNTCVRGGGTPAAHGRWTCLTALSVCTWNVSFLRRQGAFSCEHGAAAAGTVVGAQRIHCSKCRSGRPRRWSLPHRDAAARRRCLLPLGRVPHGGARNPLGVHVSMGTARPRGPRDGGCALAPHSGRINQLDRRSRRLRNRGALGVARTRLVGVDRSTRGTDREPTSGQAVVEPLTTSKCQRHSCRRDPPASRARDPRATRVRPTRGGDQPGTDHGSRDPEVHRDPGEQGHRHAGQRELRKSPVPGERPPHEVVGLLALPVGEVAVDDVELDVLVLGEGTRRDPAARHLDQAVVGDPDRVVPVRGPLVSPRNFRARPHCTTREKGGTGPRTLSFHTPADTSR